MRKTEKLQCMNTNKKKICWGFGFYFSIFSVLASLSFMTVFFQCCIIRKMKQVIAKNCFYDYKCIYIFIVKSHMFDFKRSSQSILYHTIIASDKGYWSRSSVSQLQFIWKRLQKQVLRSRSSVKISKHPITQSQNPPAVVLCR